MDGDRRNIKSYEGLPPLGGQTYYGEDGLAYGGHRVVTPPPVVDTLEIAMLWPIKE